VDIVHCRLGRAFGLLAVFRLLTVSRLLTVLSIAGFRSFVFGINFVWAFTAHDG
jgi:hypothetical protein